MRIFGSDRISGLMERLGMEEGVPIEHKMVTNAIARAQKQVEAQNFSIRKHLLEYDDVMNKQRENVYSLRRQLLDGSIVLEAGEATVTAHEYLMTVAEDVLDAIMDEHCSKDVDEDQWDLDALEQEIMRVYGLEPDDLGGGGPRGAAPRRGPRPAVVRDQAAGTRPRSSRSGQEILRVARGRPRPAHRGRTTACGRRTRPDAERPGRAGLAILEPIERNIMLQIVDTQWKDHLYSLDHLKEGIGLRGYGQRDPLVEYKKESFALFQGMRERVDEETLRYLWRLRPVIGDGGAAPPLARQPQRRPAPIFTNEGGRAGAAPALAGAARQRRGDQRPPKAGADAAATTRPSRPCDARNRRLAGTTRARAGAGRSTRSATEPTEGPRRHDDEE